MKKGGKNVRQGYKTEKSVEFIAEKIIENALNLKASDVHIEPREDYTLIRFRIHGSLRDFEKLPKDHAKKLAKHFKSVGGLDFSEKVFAQSMSFKHGNCRIRASISPTFLGEKTTLRLLSAKSRVRSLEEIGLFGDNLRRVRQAIRQPHGIIFTLGKGKNNTNFALLKEIISSEKNVVTVENHIEKSIAEINQTEINQRIGLDYYHATKAALNQNPDVILIDNLQDPKTAELIFDAATRGKLIIASLPISKTSEVIPYLEFLKVPNFLLSTNILLIISQILVRTASENALEFKKINKIESRVILKEFQTDINQLHSLEKSAKKFLGGDKIHTSDSAILEIPQIKPELSEIGFTGITGIFEVLSLIDGKIGKDFKKLIASSPNSSEIEEFLEENNFTTLKIDGLIKSLRGKTSLKEIMRKTGY